MTAPASPTASRLAVAVAGASGRMGRMLVDAVLASDDCRLAGALDVPTSPLVGQDAAAVSSVAGGRPTGVAITAFGGGDPLLQPRLFAQRARWDAGGNRILPAQLLTIDAAAIDLQERSP